MLIYSDHAQLRAIQWNFSEEQIRFIVKHGNRCRNAGVIFCQMWDKTFPATHRTQKRYEKLAGSTVVLSSCGRVVVTMYRNEKAFKRDRSKSKYVKRWQQIARNCDD